MRNILKLNSCLVKVNYLGTRCQPCRSFSLFQSCCSKKSSQLPSLQSQLSLTRSLVTCSPDSALFGFGSSKNKNDEGIIERIRHKMGLTGAPKSALLASGYVWYIKIADEINYKDFFQFCDLEDTFSSWFYVVELHMWLLSARFMAEGEEGRMIRNSMLKAMWQDIDTRSKKLEGALSSARRAQIQELNEQFQASLVSYDEGLLSSDKVLAGALWRRFLRGKSPENDEELLKQIVALEMLVIYVRHQFYILNKLNKEQLYFERNVKWTPFTEDLLNLVHKKASDT